MHNKVGEIPLCSSTKSGKLIDRIIEQFPNQVCLKTNLYATEYLPAIYDERYELAMDWVDRIEPSPIDIIVLLGAIVQADCLYTSDNIIKVKHPSSQRSHRDMDSYVNDCVNKINIILEHSGSVSVSIQAEQQFNEIMKGRNEAKLIQKGLKEAKTFDEFLNEL